MSDNRQKRYCSVVDCHSHHKDPSVTLFNFPKRNPIQAKLWAKAIRRTNSDGTQWTPNEASRICSKHFVSGRYSRTRSNPDYVPSIFPSSYHKRGKSQSDVNRHNRVSCSTIMLKLCIQIFILILNLKIKLCIYLITLPCINSTLVLVIYN